MTDIERESRDGVRHNVICRRPVENIRAVAYRGKRTRKDHVQRLGFVDLSGCVYPRKDKVTVEIPCGLGRDASVCKKRNGGGGDVHLRYDLRKLFAVGNAVKCLSVVRDRAGCGIKALRLCKQLKRIGHKEEVRDSLVHEERCRRACSLLIGDVHNGS